jgi:hypothetical protein
MPYEVDVAFRKEETKRIEAETRLKIQTAAQNTRIKKLEGMLRRILETDALRDTDEQLQMEAQELLKGE